MGALKGRMVEGGRIIAPAAFRRAKSVAHGDGLITELHGDGPRVRPVRAAPAPHPGPSRRSRP